jgi:hypothetical protein
MLANMVFRVSPLLYLFLLLLFLLRLRFLLLLLSEAQLGVEEVHVETTNM